MSQVLTYIISQATMERLIAIILSDLSGIIVAIIILYAFVLFVMTSIKSVITYTTLFVGICLQLIMGPIMFLMLVMKETSGTFTSWWKNIASMIFQQVFLFIGLTMFSTIYLNVMRGIMDFPICWEVILTLPILNIDLISGWRVAGTIPAEIIDYLNEVPSAAARTSDGPNLLSGLILIVLVYIMGKYINQITGLGAKIFTEGRGSEVDA
jgi:type IV secretory pathway VirB6-like protein